MAKIEDLSMKKRVYDHIRDMILRLELQPGERIPESQIAIDLGISRTPVREAIRRLSWEGLIDITPNHSATVTVLDNKMIQDLMLVRQQHDRLAVTLAIYNGSSYEFDNMRHIAQECLKANDNNDLWRRHELDSEFHMTLAKVSRNQMLLELHTRLSLVVRLWQAIHITNSATQRDRLNQHMELVDAMESRDTERALALIWDHTLNSYNVSFSRDAMIPPELLEMLSSGSSKLVL